LQFAIIEGMTDKMNEVDGKDLRAANQERFGARSTAYRASAVHAGGEDLERLVELLSPLTGRRALDIATGAGHVAAALAAAGAEVTASDLTANMLREAEANLSSRGLAAKYVQADALNLPFAAESFNAVTARMAPHHFADPAQFVREVFRVLRSGGSFGLVDQAAPAQAAAAETINAFEKLRDPSHNRQLSLEEWESLALTAGFAIRGSEIYRKKVEFDWWTSVQNASEETRRKLSHLLAGGPAVARQWYQPEFREDGMITHFSIPHAILLAVKPE
jgi:ubiquinone/menaquinone biosynthesis C-methylase UbiE